MSLLYLLLKTSLFANSKNLKQEKEGTIWGEKEVQQEAVQKVEGVQWWRNMNKNEV